MRDQGQASDLDRATVDGLVRLARDLSGTQDLPTMLTVFTQAIIDISGFDAAVINLVIESGDLKVVTAAGPPELKKTLLGSVGSRADWDAMLEVCTREGAVHLDYRGLVDPGGLPTWMSSDAAVVPPHDEMSGEWRPEDAVFVRLVDPAGELIGVVSVDLPRWGLRPDKSQLATLEMLARQAETAIVSARRLARTALGEHIYSTVFQTAVSPMCIVDPTGQFTQTNRRFDDVFGETADVVAFDRVLVEVEQAQGLAEQVAAVFDGPAGERTFVVGIGAADDRRWFHVSVRGVAHDSAVPVCAVCVLTEITSDRRLRDQYQHDAGHDPLTGLLNRRGFSESLPRFVEETTSGELYVAMFCDLDDFKAANDVYGHTFGDGVLVEVADRLRRAAPEPAIIGRFGGDEFVILTRAPSAHDAEQFAAAVIRLVGADLPRGDERVTASVGLAHEISGPGSDVGNLLLAADNALTRAKTAGKQSWMRA